MPMIHKIEPKIAAALEACGVPFELRTGRGDHIKVFVGGRMSAVVGARRINNDPRATQNVLAQIRRAVRAYQEANP
jgi:hypothetical protein